MKSPPGIRAEATVFATLLDVRYLAAIGGKRDEALTGQKLRS
jgi:hypothetical protein